MFGSSEALNKYFVIHFKKVNFTTNEGGSTYKCEAVPANHIGFTNIAQQIPNHYFSFWTEYNDNNLISHFCRWDPPWNNVVFNNKIGMIYTNYYNKMLNMV